MSNKPIFAIILAGGLGTRLKNHVSNLPKPLAPINNKPFLEYLLTYWLKQGIRNFIFSVGYLYKQIIEYFGNEFLGSSIDYAIEESPLGTGGGLLNALNRLKSTQETVLVVNGDSFFNVNLDKIFKFHNKHNSNWTLATFNSSDSLRYLGFCVHEDGRIFQIKNQNSNNEINVNGGVYLVKTDFIKSLGFNIGEYCSLENDLIPKAIAKKGIYSYKVDDSFIDIGTPEDYIKAQSFFENWKNRYVT